MSDNDFSIFFYGMRFIVKYLRYRVDKDCCGLIEANAMIFDIQADFVVIPLKLKARVGNSNCSISAG